MLAENLNTKLCDTKKMSWNQTNLSTSFLENVHASQTPITTLKKSVDEKMTRQKVVLTCYHDQPIEPSFQPFFNHSSKSFWEFSTVTSSSHICSLSLLFCPLISLCSFLLLTDQSETQPEQEIRTCCKVKNQEHH